MASVLLAIRRTIEFIVAVKRMFCLNKNALRILLIAGFFLAGVRTIHGSEIDALTISANIQQFHMPYGSILDPVFASSNPSSPDYSTIVGYTHAGDSAAWTGHYLAAEAFRYQVTRSPEAFANAWRALWAIRALIDITKTDVLARCFVATDSPFAAAIQQQESGHGRYDSKLGDRPFFWIGNTSRDQYSGVMFGLSVAYDMIDDPDTRAFIRTDVTRLLNNLLKNNWNVVMPDGRISTTFLQRSDQQLSFLQVGRRVNPQAFDWTYKVYRVLYSVWVPSPILFDDAEDHDHYFKFNINYINLFNLIRLEENSSAFKQIYMNAYGFLRSTTERHGNAHFNMIDRVLTGPNLARDTETVNMLNSWLQRPRRDYWIDLRNKYPACADDRACSAIPIPERVNTDFLWQRSPFLLFGGGFGTTETAGIDYLLSYWMGRLYGLPL
jgi:hypothetical protein